ncbi:hypothetical protein GMLC_23390 [Geomonas limicola]|uniref:Uncharacterized protein n=1 Tax=Geomonas limicola TaxID=2740186 RepID=A0A6V8N8M4_9BACT|nr:hypothetical protein GMLC_23390 [Geomonas limicola]
MVSQVRGALGEEDVDLVGFQEKRHQDGRRNRARFHRHPVPCRERGPQALRYRRRVAVDRVLLTGLVVQSTGSLARLFNSAMVAA